MPDDGQYVRSCATCSHFKGGQCDKGRAVSQKEACAKYEFNIFIKRPPKKRSLPKFSEDDFSID